MSRSQPFVGVRLRPLFDQSLSCHLDCAYMTPRRRRAPDRNGGKIMNFAKKSCLGVCLLVSACSSGSAIPETALPSAANAAGQGGATGRHVVLLSIDGFHQLDLDRWVASHPASTLASLVARGTSYTHVTSSRPSDSFPGTLAMTTG